MRHELVLQRQWLDDDDFMAEMSLATLVPGAIAVNVALFAGAASCEERWGRRRRFLVPFYLPLG